jgi:chloramphenicol 3-O phosphotransferase
VRCPLEVVLRRERERKDRTIGQAEAQHAVVHRWGGYDVEVDTSELSAEEAAARIGSALANGFPDRPLGRLVGDAR